MKIVLIGADIDPVSNDESRAHPNDETLEQYALGRLRSSKLRPVEEHLFVCHSCQDRLVEMDAFVGTMRSALNELPEQPPQKTWRDWLIPAPTAAWATAMACLIAVVVIARWPEGPAQPQVVALRAVRGVEQPVNASPGAPLDLRLEDSGLSSGQPYRIEIANQNGAAVWYGSVTWADGRALVRVPRAFSPGIYWVRLFEAQPDGEQLREYGLRIGP